jgi:hypothetical protein
MNSTVSNSPALALIAGPWLLLGLALSGPFLVLLTVVAAIVVASALVAGVVALAAAPVVLLRRRRAVAASRPSFRLEQVTA